MRLTVLGLVLLLIGCGDEGVPFDELPLRDALRADPEVIAGLPEVSRLRLGDRLETARAADDTADGVNVDGGGEVPAALVRALDRARARRQADALIVGAIDAEHQARPLLARTQVDVGGVALTIDDPGAEAGAAPVLAARALEGKAGASLRALAAATGARTFRRVTGWPIGALAIGDTIYVNAAWLVALAAGQGADGGMDAAPGGLASSSVRAADPSSAPLALWPGTAGASAAPPAVPSTSAAGHDHDDGIRTSALTSADGGVDAREPIPIPIPTPTPTPVSTDDDCATACNAGASSCASDPSYGNDDSCGSSDDSGDACSDSGDDGSDACANSGDSGSDACSGSGDGSAQACDSAGSDSGSCQIGRRRGGGGPGSHGSLLAPLGYLLLRRRR